MKPTKAESYAQLRYMEIFNNIEKDARPLFQNHIRDAIVFLSMNTFVRDPDRLWIDIDRLRHRMMLTIFNDDNSDDSGLSLVMIWENSDERTRIIFDGKSKMEIIAETFEYSDWHGKKVWQITSAKMSQVRRMIKQNLPGITE